MNDEIFLTVVAADKFFPCCG